MKRRPDSALAQMIFDFDLYKDAYDGDYEDPENAFRAGVADGLCIAANALGFDLRNLVVRDGFKSVAIANLERPRCKPTIRTGDNTHFYGVDYAGD